MFLIIALIWVVTALGIYTNEKPSDPEELVEELNETNPGLENFIENRFVDLAVATKRNALNNDLRAKRLRYGSLFILLGMTFQALFLIYSIIK